MLVSVRPTLLFNIGEVHHFNTAKNRIWQRPGISGLLTSVHTGVYVEKHPCHYYGNKSRLYTALHKNGMRVYILSAEWGMSLLETSS